jgi:hypothetical protein
VIGKFVGLIDYFLNKRIGKKKTEEINGLFGRQLGGDAGIL